MTQFICDQKHARVCKLTRRSPVGRSAADWARRHPQRPMPHFPSTQTLYSNVTGMSSLLYAHPSSLSLHRGSPPKRSPRSCRRGKGAVLRTPSPRRCQASDKLCQGGGVGMGWCCCKSFHRQCPAPAAVPVCLYTPRFYHDTSPAFSSRSNSIEDPREDARGRGRGVNLAVLRGGRCSGMPRPRGRHSWFRLRWRVRTRAFLRSPLSLRHPRSRPPCL